MEVLLREDLDNLGTRGQVVKVKSGYARNYLIPRRLAVAATEANKKIVGQERDAHLRKEAKLASEAQELARLMGSVSVTIHQKAGENDQLFGSVTSQNLADALEKQGYKIDRKKIQLEHPIRTIGDHKVAIKLHKDVSFDLPVHVVKEED